MRRCLAGLMLLMCGWLFGESAPPLFKELSHSSLVESSMYAEIQYSCDCLGHPLRASWPKASGDTKKRYDGMGRLIEETDALGRTTQYAYNSCNKMTSARYPDGTQEQWEYDFRCQLTRHTSRLGAVTDYELDGRGRVIQERVADPSGHLLAKRSFEFEGNRLLSSTDATGVTTYYLYDGVGRLTEKYRADRRSSYEWDHLGRKVRRTDGDKEQAHTTFWYYDAMGRLIEKRMESSDGSVLERRRYEYDQRGHVTALELDRLGEDQQRREWEYDAACRLIRSVDPQGREAHYSYEEMEDHLLQIATLSNGAERRTTFDRRGLPVCTEQLNAAGRTVSTCVTTYDLAGRKVSEESSSGDMQSVSKWQYDDGGRVLRYSHRVKPAKPTVVAYSYDERGQLQALSLPQGRAFHYVFNCLGQLVDWSGKGFAYHFVYDGEGRLVKITDDEGRETRREYNVHGEMVAEVLQNGLPLRFSYDYLGRRKWVELEGGQRVTHGPQPAWSSTGQWDGDFEKLAGLERLRGSKALQVVTPLAFSDLWERCQSDEEESVLYDALGNVLEVASEGVRFAFTYDPLGRRMTEEFLVCDGKGGWSCVGRAHLLYDGERLIGIVDAISGTVELRLSL